MHNSASCNNRTKMDTSSEKSKAGNERDKSKTATNCASSDFFHLTSNC